MDPATPDRRRAKRYGDVRFKIGWRLDRADTRRAEGLRGPPLPAEVGVLLNASTIGASVLAPSARELRVGSTTRMSFRGVSGLVVIRRIGVCADPSRSVYGVEFAEPGSALTALVYDTFVGDYGKTEARHPYDARTS